MKQFLFAVLFGFSLCGIAQNIQSPSEFLGYPLGSQFTRHHRVVDYYEYLAHAAADRMRLQQYGTTYEGRPLLLAYLSSPENMRNLDAIRREHLKSTMGPSKASVAIVWLSYNVHGNESVSTEASMQTAYALLTSDQDYLSHTVVIMDPCINPDGRDRYVNWYKQFRNSPYQADPNSVEHHEGWLNGRSNHYMFDLNRDWAWLTQAESRQRIKKYNEWLPHIHVDFHEQGINDPYYFAPAAEPFHEVITDFQRDFQVTLGKNHARYFDQQGWLYFTKEVFDLFYPSYGDTYPTYNGAVGLTYEQGGSGRAGLGVRTTIGDTLTLKDRIAHHLTTGLSTVEVASRNAARLNEEFTKFYKNRNYRYKNYVLKGNPDMLDALTELLDAHEISYGAGTGTSVKGYRYSTRQNGSMTADKTSLVVSTEQVKGTLVKVLFEPNAKLSDSLTYDITAWSLPYAYGLDALATENQVPTQAYSRQESTVQELDAGAYAFITDWNSMRDARFLADLLGQGIRVRRASKPFTLKGRGYERGSLIILRGDNQLNPQFLKNLSKTARRHAKQIDAVQTGFVDEGKDFGSESVQIIRPPKVAVLSGKPVNSLDFGEVWHFFEQQLHYPLTVIRSDYLDEVSLSAYDVLILPGGYNYPDFYKDGNLERLKKWVADGGNLLVMQEAIRGLEGEDGFGIRKREIAEDSIPNTVEPREDLDRLSIRDEITGAIFKARVDDSNPLAFGYGDTYYTLKLGSNRYEYLDNGTVAYLEENPVPVAGFAGSEALKKRDHTLIFGEESHGSGHVVYLVDDPLFRAFWENGKLFFANALFMLD